MARASLLEEGEDFDIIAIQSRSPDRLQELEQEHSALLTKRVTLAICSKATAHERAVLLSFGYDDIFEIDMDIIEAKARVTALYRLFRKVAGQGSVRPPKVPLDKVKVYFEQKPTQREYEFLSRLIEAKGKSVPYEKLVVSEYELYKIMTMNHLRVFVNRIRSKLKSGYYVHNSNSGGYYFSTEK